MNKKYNIVDLFCGCGGLSLGLEQAGFSVSFASDIDPVCTYTYMQNREISDDQMFVGDISDLNEKYGFTAQQIASDIERMLKS